MALGPKYWFEREIDAQLTGMYVTGIEPTSDDSGTYFTVTLPGPLNPGDDFDITRIYVQAGWGRVWLKPGTFNQKFVAFRLYLPKRI